MPAPLNKKQFYHGTDHPFNVGDTVNTGKDGFAWASTNVDVAREYGPMVFTVSPTEDIAKVPGASKESGIYASRTGFTVTGRHE